MKKILLICAFSAWFFGCSDDKTGTPKSGKDVLTEDGAVPHSPKLGDQIIFVVDAFGTPIAGAKILIGTAIHAPFAENFLLTDSAGLVALPKAWQDVVPVTVQAPGYVRLTTFGNAPKGMTIKLRKTDTPPNIQLKGTTTGHAVKNSDGLVDFGLVLPSLTRNDLLTLNLSKIISNRTDPISVIGHNFDMPSNVTLPAQSESYLFFPIKLSKPDYRLYFSAPGPHRIYGAMARFPLKPVIDAFRGGKKFYDLVNTFTIMSGVVRDVNVSNGTTVDLAVGEMAFDSKLNFRAPAIPADEVMMAMAAIDTGDGSLVPTDVKKFESNQTLALTTPSRKRPYALAMLKNANEFDGEGGGADRVSVVIMPFTNNFTPRFLPLVKDPRVLPNGDLQFVRPTLPPGVSDLATYASFSEVRSLPMGQEQNLPFLVRLWEVYAPNWVDGMTLPRWPEGTAQPTKKRWEVTYIGSQSTKEDVELGQAVIDAATHVTHASVDY